MPMAMVRQKQGQKITAFSFCLIAGRMARFPSQMIKPVKESHQNLPNRHLVPGGEAKFSMSPSFA
jgi:hypothetical protein